MANPYNGNITNLTIGGVFEYSLLEVEEDNLGDGFNYLKVYDKKPEWALQL